MPWIQTVMPANATGRLKELYDAAVLRAGKVWNIVRLMSLRPGQLESSMDLYKVIMFGESELSRAERELVATVVSLSNKCRY
ncbi:MAG TPA: carboxymuconolactone decarboxylase family protein [Planctomycetota bacterium]|nr:carboxymuconolactone decarboxylase family protein [Planctomycetota bacterium]